MTQRLLLLSNSTNPGEAFLQWPESLICEFLGEINEPLLFIPYAGVTVTWDEYVEKVANRFRELDYTITSIHGYDQPVEAIRSAPAIVVGGGNTFHLVHHLIMNDLIKPIREQIAAGTPYLGWSAGANVACPTLRTTNDMPIVQPEDFKTLDLIPFQINPHYRKEPQGKHGGETRDDRIQEFLHLNQDVTVIGLREGTGCQVVDSTVRLVGDHPARIFKYNRKSNDVTDLENILIM